MPTIFEEVRENREGHVATYIPQLALVEPEQWGLAVTQNESDNIVPYLDKEYTTPKKKVKKERGRNADSEDPSEAREEETAREDAT